jgi:hypothetical protein
MNELPPISPGTNSCRVPAQMWQGSGQWARDPADVGGVSPAPLEIHQVPAQMGVGRVSPVPALMAVAGERNPGSNVAKVPQSRYKCGSGERSSGADAGRRIPAARTALCGCCSR